VSVALARVVGLGLLAVLLCGLAFLAFRGSTVMVGPSQPAPDALGATPPGSTLFQAKGCSGCHSFAGISTSRVGPDLTRLFEEAGGRKADLSAEAYVRESIVDPQAFVVRGYAGLLMPRLRLSDGEVDALVAFLLEGSRL
jgi:cytochrome c551/c552